MLQIANTSTSNVTRRHVAIDVCLVDFLPFPRSDGVVWYHLGIHHGFGSRWVVVLND